MNVKGLKTRDVDDSRLSAQTILSTISSPSRFFSFLYSLGAPKSALIESQYNRLLPLFVYESNLRLVQHTGIGSCTWFQGNPTDATVFLKDRTRTVLLKNPWLMAKVVTYKGKDHLAFNDGEKFDIAEAVEKSFFIQGNCSLDPNSSVEATSEYALAKEMICTNPTKQVGWKVTVLTDPKVEDRFGLIFSLCHQVGDGHSFYRIYKMLVNPEEPIVALDPRRDFDLVKMRTEILGEGSNRAQDNLATVWHCAIFRRFHFFPKPRLCQSFVLDAAKIEEEKMRIDRERDGVRFISTNDIVTSWYAQNAGSVFTRMSVNFRGRYPGLTDDLCANFQGLVFLSSPQDTATPASIRKLVEKMSRGVSDFPTTFQMLVQGKHNVITNWTSFSGLGPLEPPNCKELRHLPLMSNPEGNPSGGHAIVHRLCEGQMAVVVESPLGANHRVKIPDFGKPLPSFI